MRVRRIELQAHCKRALMEPPVHKELVEVRIAEVLDRIAALEGRIGAVRTTAERVGRKPMALVLDKLAAEVRIGVEHRTIVEVGRKPEEPVVGRRRRRVHRVRDRASGRASGRDGRGHRHELVPAAAEEQQQQVGRNKPWGFVGRWNEMISIWLPFQLPVRRRRQLPQLLQLLLEPLQLVSPLRRLQRRSTTPQWRPR